MKNIFTFFLLFSLLSNVFAQQCPPYDPTFGTNGMAISNISIYNPHTIVQPDGKIIQIADLFGKIIFYRLNFNGSPDLSFGSLGNVTFSTNSSNMEYNISDVLLQPDGKIIIAGEKYYNNNNIFNISLFRFNNNGTIDPTFGFNGEKQIEIVLGTSRVNAITLQPDGKIIISGTGYSQTDLCQINTWKYPNAFIARINLDGSIDNNFGVNGKILLSSPNYFDYNLDVAVQSNGKILLAIGQGNECSCQPDGYGGIGWYCKKSLLLLKRLNPGGTPDSSFGINGQVTDSTLIGESYEGIFNTHILVLPDDKIVFVVDENNYPQNYEIKLNQYTRDGSPDNGFGINGKTFLKVGDGASLQDVLIQPDGRILLLGNVSNNFGFDPMSFLVRYRSNGDLDSSFYLNGITVFSIDKNKAGFSNSIALQENKIIVGGINGPNNGQRMVAIRILEKIEVIDPAVTADGPLTFCYGESVTLSTPLIGNYQWYSSNSILNGSTSSTYKATGNGTYRLMVINSTGCGISSDFQVVVKSLPAIYDINFNGSLLSTDAGYIRYQWYLNGTAILGANSNVYSPGTNLGTYKVQVFNADNCSIFSKDFSYVITGIADLILGDTKMRYYPNPAQNKLNIDIAKLSGRKINADIFDMSGKLMVSQSLIQGHNEIQLSGIPSGVYSLVVRSGNETAVRKLMIVK